MAESLCREYLMERFQIVRQVCDNATQSTGPCGNAEPRTHGTKRDQGEKPYE
jgi:hypothetical protein